MAKKKIKQSGGDNSINVVATKGSKVSVGSEDNGVIKAAWITVIGMIVAAIIAGIFGYLPFNSEKNMGKEKASISQNTGIDGINAIADNKSSITINKYGLTKDEVLHILKDAGVSHINDRLIQNLLNQIEAQSHQVDAHVFTISEQTVLIEKQGQRIKEILTNEDVSSEIKALIEQGDIDGAEVLVDKHYEEKLKNDDATLAKDHNERGLIKALN